MNEVNLQFKLLTNKADASMEATAKKGSDLFEKRGFKLNVKGGDLPLGRITGDFEKFQGSLDAATARVLAFTATTGAVYGLSTAFTRLFTDSVKLEKQLAGIQAILQTSNSNLQKFSSELFNVANATGQSFDVAAEAASEFARQGLSVEETLKATNAALTFSKIAGVSAAQAVENLTASLNTFNNEALNYNDVVDTIVSLDNAFAISAGGIADGLKRVGSVASESGIQLKEIASLISVVQQVSARGAPVISNGLKTIFTRLGRSKVQESLNSIGVSTQDANGEFRSQIDILTDLSNKLDNLSDSQRAFILEQVAGVYQINTLQATLKSLNGEYSLFDKAVKVASDSSGNAANRLKILTDTTDANLQKLKNNVTQFLAEVGKATVKPLLDNFVGIGNTILETLNLGSAAKGGEEAGITIGSFLLNGISSALSGPGTILIIATVAKLLGKITKDAASALGTLSGLKKASLVDSQTQKTVNEAIAQGNKYLVSRLATTTSIVEKMQILDRLLTNQTNKQGAAQINQVVAVGLSANNIKVPPKGKAKGHIPTYSDGYIPPEVKNAEKKGVLSAGYAWKGNSSVVSSPVGGFMNTAETVSIMPTNNFGGFASKKIFINPPPNSTGGIRHQEESIRKTGIDPYEQEQFKVSSNGVLRSSGFIPNFAKTTFDKDAKGELKSIQYSGTVSGKQSSRIADSGLDNLKNLKYNVVSLNSPDYIKGIKEKLKGPFTEEKARFVANIARNHGYSKNQIESFIENLKTGGEVPRLGMASKRFSKSPLAKKNKNVTIQSQIDGFANNVGSKMFERTGVRALNKNSNSEVFTLSDDPMARMDILDSKRQPIGEIKAGRIVRDNLISKAIESNASTEEQPLNKFPFYKTGAEEDIQFNSPYTLVKRSSNSNAALPFSNKGFIPNFASRYTEARKQKRDQLRASLFNIGDFAGGEIKNVNAQTEFNQARDKNPNVEFDDKINQVGFKVERIPILDREFEDALRSKENNKEVTTKFENYAIDYLNGKGYSFKAGRNTLYGKENAAVDGYNIKQNFIELLEVKGGKWDAPDVNNKFGRFAPENLVDLGPQLVSKFFKEGNPDPNINDKIRIRNVLAIPNLTGGVFKKNIAPKYPSVDVKTIEKARQSTRKSGSKIPAKYAWMVKAGLIPPSNSSGFIPNFAAVPPRPISLAYNPAHKERKRIEGGLRSRGHQVSDVIGTLLKIIPENFLKGKVLGDEGEGLNTGEDPFILAALDRIQGGAHYLGPKAGKFVYELRKRGYKVTKSLERKLSRKAAKIIGPKYNAEGFIPNFSPYVDSVMGLEKSISGKAAVLDYKSGFGPFIRNTGQSSFADAIADHGGLKNAMGDSMAGQRSAGLMSGGFIPNFAGKGAKKKRAEKRKLERENAESDMPDTPDMPDRPQQRGQGSAAIVASLALPALLGGLLPAEEQDRSTTQKIIGGAGEAVGSAIMAASVTAMIPGLQAFAPLVGAAVFGYQSINTVLRATIPSTKEQVKANEKLITENENSVNALNETIRAQEQLTELQSSGADLLKIAKAQLEYNRSLSKIKDVNLVKTLTTEKDQGKREEAILAFQEKTRKETQFSSSAAQFSQLSEQTAQKRSGFMNLIAPSALPDFGSENWDSLLTPIIESLDLKKLSGESLKSLKSVSEGSTTFIDFLSKFGKELGLSNDQLSIATKTFASFDGVFSKKSLEAVNKYAGRFTSFNLTLESQSNKLAKVPFIDLEKIFRKSIEDLSKNVSLANVKNFAIAESDARISENQLGIDQSLGRITPSELVKRRAADDRKAVSNKFLVAESKLKEEKVKQLSEVIPKDLAPEKRALILESATDVLAKGADIRSLADVIKKSVGTGSESNTILAQISKLTEEVIQAIYLLDLDVEVSNREISKIEAQGLAAETARRNIEIGEGVPDASKREEPPTPPKEEGKPPRKPPPPEPPPDGLPPLPPRTTEIPLISVIEELQKKITALEDRLLNEDLPAPGGLDVPQGIKIADQLKDAQDQLNRLLKQQETAFLESQGEKKPSDRLIRLNELLGASAKNQTQGRDVRRTLAESGIRDEGILNQIQDLIEIGTPESDQKAGERIAALLPQKDGVENKFLSQIMGLAPEIFKAPQPPKDPLKEEVPRNIDKINEEVKKGAFRDTTAETAAKQKLLEKEKEYTEALKAQTDLTTELIKLALERAEQVKEDLKNTKKTEEPQKPRSFLAPFPTRKGASPSLNPWGSYTPPSSEAPKAKSTMGGDITDDDFIEEVIKKPQQDLIESLVSMIPGATDMAPKVGDMVAKMTELQGFTDPELQKKIDQNKIQLEKARKELEAAQAEVTAPPIARSLISDPASTSQALKDLQDPKVKPVTDALEALKNINAEISKITGKPLEQSREESVKKSLMEQYVDPRRQQGLDRLEARSVAGQAYFNNAKTDLLEFDKNYGDLLNTDNPNQDLIEERKRLLLKVVETQRDSLNRDEEYAKFQKNPLKIGSLDTGIKSFYDEFVQDKRLSLVQSAKESINLSENLDALPEVPVKKEPLPELPPLKIATPVSTLNKAFQNLSTVPLRGSGAVFAADLMRPFEDSVNPRDYDTYSESEKNIQGYTSATSSAISKYIEPVAVLGKVFSEVLSGLTSQFKDISILLKDYIPEGTNLTETVVDNSVLKPLIPKPYLDIIPKVTTGGLIKSLIPEPSVEKPAPVQTPERTNPLRFNPAYTSSGFLDPAEIENLLQTILSQTSKDIAPSSVEDYIAGREGSQETYSKRFETSFRQRVQDEIQAGKLKQTEGGTLTSIPYSENEIIAIGKALEQLAPLFKQIQSTQLPATGTLLEDLDRKKALEQQRKAEQTKVQQSLGNNPETIPVIEKAVKGLISQSAIDNAKSLTIPAGATESQKKSIEADREILRKYNLIQTNKQSLTQALSSLNEKSPTKKLSDDQLAYRGQIFNKAYDKLAEAYKKNPTTAGKEASILLQEFRAGERNVDDSALQRSGVLKDLIDFAGGLDNLRNKSGDTGLREEEQNRKNFLTESLKQLQDRESDILERVNSILKKMDDTMVVPTAPTIAPPKETPNTPTVPTQGASTNATTETKVVTANINVSINGDSINDRQLSQLTAYIENVVSQSMRQSAISSNTSIPNLGPPKSPSLA